MKKSFYSLCLLSGLLFAACSSDTEQMPGATFGSINMDVKSNTTFKRALKESDYSVVNNYTVQIFKSTNTGTPVAEFLYGDRSATINLENGNYTIKAFYGAEHNASRDEFYVFGQTDFTIDADNKTVNINCAPTCGRLRTVFAENMATDFSSYYVEYTTEALTAAGTVASWSSTDTEPWYVKLNPAGETVKATIHLTRSLDGKETTVKKEYAMTPGKSWTMNIAAKDGSGNLGIEITIDESTNDRPVDIEVPSEWI